MRLSKIVKNTIVGVAGMYAITQVVAFGSEFAYLSSLSSNEEKASSANIQIDMYEKNYRWPLKTLLLGQYAADKIYSTDEYYSK